MLHAFVRLKWSLFCCRVTKPNACCAEATRSSDSRAQKEQMGAEETPGRRVTRCKPAMWKARPPHRNRNTTRDTKRSHHDAWLSVYVYMPQPADWHNSSSGGLKQLNITHISFRCCQNVKLRWLHFAARCFNKYRNLKLNSIVGSLWALLLCIPPLK